MIVGESKTLWAIYTFMLAECIVEYVFSAVQKINHVNLAVFAGASANFGGELSPKVPFTVVIYRFLIH